MARFHGGSVTSDGGALLWREVERQTGLLRRFAACCTDQRASNRVEHPVKDLSKQRLYALAWGSEERNDHDRLRQEPRLARRVGTPDPTGQTRTRVRDRGNPLAGKSTLNRLELRQRQATPTETRDKKILLDPTAGDQGLVDVFLDAHAAPPAEIGLDLDAPDDPLHGPQAERFFHGDYGHYGYVPLYSFAGEFLRCARLRPAHRDARAGAWEDIPRLGRHLRTHWPAVRSTRRADSGGCRAPLMAWCEAQGVTDILGLAKNRRLLAQGQAELAQAQAQFAQPGQPARVFTEFRDCPRHSWTPERRGVAKAAPLEKGRKPRCVGTSWPSTPWTAQTVYEQLYCARGARENRSKEPPLDLCADRPSTAKLGSNQIRWYFSSCASLLLQALRRLGRHGTEMAPAQCGTLRLRLRKIGALLTVNARRIGVALASGDPYVTLFQHVYTPLRCWQKRPLGASRFASQANVYRNGQATCVRRRWEGTKICRLASSRGSVHPSSSPLWLLVRNPG